MFKWINADQFLYRFFDGRLGHFSGNYGSSKTSLGALLSYTALRQDLVDNCVSTAPISWAVPAQYCRPYRFFVLMDEMGAVFDARSFANRQQNDFRKAVISYLRKIEAYVVASSYVSPDASFRSFAVQRLFAFPFLETYRYSYEEGQQGGEGWFGVWDRAWLWRVDKFNPSPKYSHRYIPSSFKPIADLFQRAFAEVKQDDDYDPHQLSEADHEAFLDRFCRWYRVEPRTPSDPGQDTGSADRHYLPQSGASAKVGVSQQEVYVGNLGEQATSGRISYRH